MVAIRSAHPVLILHGINEVSCPAIMRAARICFVYGAIVGNSRSPRHFEIPFMQRRLHVDRPLTYDVDRFEINQ